MQTESPSGPLQQLSALAQAAIAHASHEHQADLTQDDVAACERLLIIERERWRGNPSAQDDRLEPLAACYGAWLGAVAEKRFNAHWAGLHESAAPRLIVAGVLCSPIDAVRRFLLNADAISPEEMMRRFAHWYVAGDRSREAVVDENRSAWDQRGDDLRFAGAESPPASRDAARGAIDPWILETGVLNGGRLLCLAAGGGRHAPLYALAGAKVTVVDISESQLHHDREAALRWGVELEVVTASLDAFALHFDQPFDVVVQPVSACYIPDLPRMYHEIATVMRPGGLYVVQHKQPVSLCASATLNLNGRFELVHPKVEGGVLPPVTGDWLHRETGCVEFVHSLESQLGGLCRAGFSIEDVVEPPRGDALAPLDTWEYRCAFIPPYLKIKARRQSPTP